MMNVNSGAAHAKDYAAIHQRMSPYNADTIAAPAHDSNAGVHSFERISSNIASAITDQED